MYISLICLLTGEFKPCGSAPSSVDFHMFIPLPVSYLLSALLLSIVAPQYLFTPRTAVITCLNDVFALSSTS